MKVEIYDLPQFFKFCQVHTCLVSIAEENHQMLYDDISKFLRESKKTVTKCIKSKSPLRDFCENNNFKIIDLDLLNIALLKQKSSISIEDYFEKSIFEVSDKSLTHEIINKLKRSQIIKNDYLTLEDPFNERENSLTEKKPTKKQPRNDIIQLLNNKPAKKRSNKKFKIEFPCDSYLKLYSLLKDIFLLDRILNANIEKSKGFSKSNLNLLYNAYLKNIKQKYKKTLDESKKDFSKFLSTHKIKLTDFILIASFLNDRNDFHQSSFDISNELYMRFKDFQSIDKLLKNKIVKKYWGWYELTPKAMKGLLSIESEEEEEDTLLIPENPSQTFKNVCLTSEVRKQILNTIDQYKHKDLIFNKWGLGESIGYGRGITLNLSGPPGTGKTLSVRAIANYLSKKLLTVNLPKLKSMWVGGSEKNIREAFKIAKKKDAVLFFDEADSLTTKRENARASYEISETNTLLKELENFEGVCIFATNFSENYDEAFNRRLSAHVNFKLPDKDQLKKIFEIHFPKKEVLSKDVNFLDFAKKYAGLLSGGDVKNIVLNSARIAASDEYNINKIITKYHISKACEVVLNGKKNIMCVSENVLRYFG